MSKPFFCPARLHALAVSLLVLAMLLTTVPHAGAPGVAQENAPCGGILVAVQDARRQGEAVVQYGVVSENLWSPHFLQPWRLMGDEEGLLKSIRRRYGDSYPSATMRVAPDDPKNGSSLEGLFSEQGFRQAIMPFTSSNFSVAKPVGRIVTAKRK